MLPEAELIAALRRIPTQTVNGYCSRFVEFRRLIPTLPQPSGPRPLWGLGSKRYGGRFTPKGGFETVCLAEDPVTAMAEVRGVLVSSLSSLRTVQPPLVLITVETILLRVLDVTLVEVQAGLGTNARELTGAWRHLQADGREAPTQALGHVCHESGRFEAIRFPSSKNAPNGICIAVFTDRLRPPSTIKVFDPHGGIAQELP